MADAMQASCTAPVYKRPRLEFPPYEDETLIPYESMSSEKRFSVNSEVTEDSYEMASNDSPINQLEGNVTRTPTFSVPDFNGACSTSGSNMEQPTLDPNYQNDCVPEDLPNCSNEVCNEPGIPSTERDLDENEDQDSITHAAWIEKQKNSGMDPRMLLGDLLPKGTLIPSNVNESLLWRFLVNMLDSPPRRSKLTAINTIDDVVHLLRTCKKIIVLTGAGVSVSCGIPDFRSRDGIYSRLSKDYPELRDPQSMFDIEYFKRDPRPFFKFAKEIYPGQFQPSPSHRFIRVLEKQGKLLRNYSQNIDTLEHAAGIQNVITCHGSFATATCTGCRYQVDSSVIKEDIFNQTIPYCVHCPTEEPRGIMKPDIVFFGEGLSDEFHECLNEDKDVCDLLIVIGSSLKVRPVACIPTSIPNHVPQILINREPLKHLTFDIELLGNCDVIIGELCQRLKTEWAVDENIPLTSLTEVNVIPPKQNFHPLSDLVALDSTDLVEINNNYQFAQGQTSNFTQSEESNSCDYNGLSAIKLDDSEDGSNQEQVVDSSNNQTDLKLDEIYSSTSWTDSFSRKLPDQSYLYCPPSRYVFQGAEIYRDEDDDCCSTPTDYSSDSDSPQRPASDDGDTNTRLSLENNYVPSQPESSDQQCPVSNESGIDTKFSDESSNT
ncbi:NAD-dependent protein deacetylase sirtuin-1 [Caerostris darwini]|uniref:protein acetyllysine N-acetyltransferase n=1 Tax=Caerostris darwini TaxID=1538125 RepID=A0AAV4RPZ1_9ARAC|nr:NAD-dependent protein deacetylase sirtuin-1 [Caerostris darwini]